MKSTQKVVNEIIKIHDFSAELLNHPLFRDNWYLHKPAEMFYHLKRYDECPTDLVSCAEISLVEKVASKFGFTFTGVSFENGSLQFNIYLGTLKNI